MTTQPDDDSYPESWTPPHLRRQRERERQERYEAELARDAFPNDVPPRNTQQRGV